MKIREKKKRRNKKKNHLAPTTRVMKTTRIVYALIDGSVESTRGTTDDGKQEE